MGAESPPMALSPDQLNDTDGRILDVMLDGRATPQYVADQLDLSRPYASDRLKRLVEHGHVERLAAGLYELVDDPRTDRDADEELIPRSELEELIQNMENHATEGGAENLKEDVMTCANYLENWLEERDSDGQ